MIDDFVYELQVAGIGDQGKIETDTRPLIPVNRHTIVNHQSPIINHQSTRGVVKKWKIK